MFEILKIVKELFTESVGSGLFKGKEQKARELELQLIQMMNEASNKQIEVNIQEAKHQSVFVAGWRPAIGWVCAGALAYQFILQPLLSFIFGLFTDLPELPELEISQLITIVLGMLGMAGYRTFEKLKKVN